MRRTAATGARECSGGQCSQQLGLPVAQRHGGLHLKAEFNSCARGAVSHPAPRTARPSPHLTLRFCLLLLLFACSRRGKAAEEEDDEEDEWVLPEGVEPFLSAAPLYTGAPAVVLHCLLPLGIWAVAGRGANRL